MCLPFGNIRPAVVGMDLYKWSKNIGTTEDDFDAASVGLRIGVTQASVPMA